MHNITRERRNDTCMKIMCAFVFSLNNEMYSYNIVYIYSGICLERSSLLPIQCGFSKDVQYYIVESVLRVHPFCQQNLV